MIRSLLVSMVFLLAACGSSRERENVENTPPILMQAQKDSIEQVKKDSIQDFQKEQRIARIVNSLDKMNPDSIEGVFLFDGFDGEHLLTDLHLKIDSIYRFDVFLAYDASLDSVILAWVPQLGTVKVVKRDANRYDISLHTVLYLDSMVYVTYRKLTYTTYHKKGRLKVTSRIEGNGLCGYVRPELIQEYYALAKRGKSVDHSAIQSYERLCCNEPSLARLD